MLNCNTNLDNHMQLDSLRNEIPILPLFHSMISNIIRSTPKFKDVSTRIRYPRLKFQLTRTDLLSAGTLNRRIVRWGSTTPKPRAWLAPPPPFGQGRCSISTQVTCITTVGIPEDEAPGQIWYSTRRPLHPVHQQECNPSAKPLLSHNFNTRCYQTSPENSNAGRRQDNDGGHETSSRVEGSELTEYRLGLGAPSLPVSTQRKAEWSDRARGCCRGIPGLPVPRARCSNNRNPHIRREAARDRLPLRDLTGRGPEGYPRLENHDNAYGVSDHVQSGSNNSQDDVTPPPKRALGSAVPADNAEPIFPITEEEACRVAHLPELNFRPTALKTWYLVVLMIWHLLCMGGVATLVALGKTQPPWFRFGSRSSFWM
ncbi:hypothetical protein ACJZ2D_004154 [Fusarium nematophilum]